MQGVASLTRRRGTGRGAWLLVSSPVCLQIYVPESWKLGEIKAKWPIKQAANRSRTRPGRCAGLRSTSTECANVKWHRCTRKPRRLENGVTQEHLYRICKAVLDSFTAHADRLLVIYVQKPEGSPDHDETEKYYSLLKEFRAFARRNLWKARLSWILGGFRWRLGR